MTAQELQDYFEEKKAIFTQPEAMRVLEERVVTLLNKTDYDLYDKTLASWTLELLCFTLHTEKGKNLYIKLLNHAGKQSTIIADRYWDVYDNQESLINRYDMKP
jgi:hypothetical protein